MTYKFRKIFIIIFFAIICIPLILTFTSFKGVVAVNENRILAKPPGLPSNKSEVRAFLPSLDKFIGDNFGLRNEFLLLNEYIVLKLLKTSTSDGVFIGNNGWLFFDGGNLNYYRNTALFTDKELENWVNYIKHNKKKAEDLGAQYVFFITPDSHTINGEAHLPAWFVKKGNVSKFDQLKEALSINGIDLLDVRNTLRLQAKEQKLYYQNDTHWTLMGAYYGYKELMVYLGYKPLEMDNFKTLEIKADRADMQEMLGPIGAEEKIQILVKKASPNFTIKNSGKIDIDLDVYTNCSSCPNNQNVVVFRDSYFISLFPYFSEHFKNIHYVSRNGIDWGVVRTENPTLIIEQIVERNFATFKVNFND